MDDYSLSIYSPFSLFSTDFSYMFMLFCKYNSNSKTNLLSFNSNSVTNENYTTWWILIVQTKPKLNHYYFWFLLFLINKFSLLSLSNFCFFIVVQQ